MFQELFISDIDKSRIESTDIAYNVWFFIVMGIVISVSLMLVFVIFIVASVGFGNEIFLLPFALGLFMYVLVYCGIMFLINYAYQYLKNSALQAQDDTKAHKYTIYTTVTPRYKKVVWETKYFLIANILL